MPLQHTLVPFVWRRHLGVARVLLGLGGVAVYLIWRVPITPVAALAAVAYSVFGLYVARRRFSAARLASDVTLWIDLVFFFVCLQHDGMPGVWLSTICYFYLLSLATLLYSWPHVILIVATAVGGILLNRPNPAFELWPAVLVAGVLGVLLAVQRQAMQERLSTALRRSVLSRSEAELAREKERQRIAADFHDGPLQSFISFQMRLEIIRKLLPRDPTAGMNEVLQLQDLGRSQVTELRAFVRNMQPAEVTAENLGSAVRETVEHFERDSGISAHLDCGDLSSVGEAVASEVLQIVREALNNARKHSKASMVKIAIGVSENNLQVEVEDDGSGFPFSGQFNLDELEILRLGPRSIKRRVRTIGGDLMLHSRPSGGAELTITVPLQ